MSQMPPHTLPAKDLLAAARSGAAKGLREHPHATIERHGMRIGFVLGRLLFASVGLWLFLVALGIMRGGAAALAPALESSFLFDDIFSAFGFGWLSAMMVLSGSPVAVSSLTFQHAGVISGAESFTMLAGSRFGASFVVLLVAALYAYRRKKGTKTDRKATLSVGIIALLLTFVQYGPGTVLGLTLLNAGVFEGLGAPTRGATLYEVIDLLTQGVLTAVKTMVPAMLMLPLGIAVLLVSLQVIDRALPEFDAEKIKEGGWREKPWMMFLMGSFVAFVTMSVSVAITLLVPAIAKGYIRRQHALPWIAGANITTLGDTLLTAVLLGSATGVQVVVAELVGVGFFTLLLLLTCWRPLSRAIIACADWLAGSQRRLMIFCAALAIVPISLSLL